MVSKGWPKMRDRLEKLPVAERFKKVQLLLKKERDTVLKKELQEWVVHLENQVHTIEDWHASGFARVEAMQVAQELPVVLVDTSEAEQAVITSARENLEEVLTATPTPATPVTSLGSETNISYGPSAEYVPGVMYGPSNSYNVNQYGLAQDSVHALILGEQRSSVQQREREAQERQASASEKTSLETKDFVEYKSSQSRRNPNRKL